MEFRSWEKRGKNESLKLNSQLTPEEREKSLNPPRQIYEVDSSEYSAKEQGVQATPADPVSPEECASHYLDGFSGEYWTKNRFAGCQAMFLVIDKYDCTGQGCLPVARAYAKWAMTVNMPFNTRQLNVEQRVWDWEFPVPGVGLDTIVGVEIGCLGLGLEGSTARCDIPTYGWSKTIAEWQDQSSEVISLMPQGEDPPDDSMPTEVNAEKRTHYNVLTYAYSYGGPGPWDNYHSTETVSIPYRCDIARIQNAQYVRSSDCVFHGATGWLKFDRTDPNIAESAQLIWDAHNAIEKTYPGNPGKHIPGKIGETEPLERLFHDKKLKDANRRASIAACKKGFGEDYTKRDDGYTNDCDEFPFASTYQGTFTVTEHMLRSYAVRPVHSGHNQEAGRRLGTFVAEDHLLDGDDYYVTAY